MKSKKGFTLIELLMVIAVIAVLMSILIPALGKVRALARVLVCQSNLRQWGFIWDMYTQKNNGLFDNGYARKEPKYKNIWTWTLRNYYDKQAQGITCCPMANNPNKSFEKPDGTLGPHSTMTVIQEYIPPDPFYSSYGQNAWTWNNILRDWPREHPEMQGWFWRKTGYKQSNNIPVFMDARNVYVMPESVTNEPSQWEEDWDCGNGQLFPTLMKAVTVNRHNNWHINALFMDGSVRKVLLKGLWDLYWYRGWAEERLRRLSQSPPTWPPVNWPEWMAGCPDVDYGF